MTQQKVFDKPYILVRIVGGVADLAIGSDQVDCDILDYDNLNESIDNNEAVILSDQELAYIRKYDDAQFIADVERLLVSRCCGERREYGVCMHCGQPDRRGEDK